MQIGRLPCLLLESLAHRPHHFPGAEAGEALPEARRQQGHFFRREKLSTPPQKIGSPVGTAAKQLVSDSHPAFPQPCMRQHAQALQRGRNRQSIEFREPQHLLPPVVAPEEFVGAFADLADDDAVLARQFGNVIKGNAHRIRDRLILQANHLRQKVQQVLLAEQDFVMIGVNPPGHQAGEGSSLR